MSAWIASLLRSRPDLYRAIYDWNAYPHRWALPEWLEPHALPSPVVSLLESTPAGRERLSRHYRSALGVLDMRWDFEAPARRVALLSSATLQRLARFAGAAVHAPALTRLVTKTARWAVVERIGEDAYGFALRGRPRTLQGIDAPTVAATEALGTAVEITGWRLLRLVLQDEPPVVLDRVRLKAPAAVHAALHDKPVGDAAASWAALQPVLRETLKPEELRCFA